MDRRPLSVTVVAWIILIISVIGVITYISMHGRIIEHMELTGAPVHVYYLGVVTVVIDLICSICMLQRMNWARLLFLCWGIIIYIYNLVVLSGVYLGPTIFNIVIFVIFNIFLFSSSANAYFSQGSTSNRNEGSGG